MSLEQELFDRSHSQCELCSANQNLSAYIIPPKVAENVDHAVLVCVTCLNQIEDPDLMDLNHWRCLNDSIWNQNPAVQVVSWRMLNRIKDHGWPKDLMEMMYMEAETLAWARAEDDLINP
ncbi:MAG: PhnA protein, partial [Flavobacteriaceae bacterium]|nr:PhnA protein [Flavobacteriaceae bacterium]